MKGHTISWGECTYPERVTGRYVLTISEIDDFAKTEAGKEWESSWYDDLKQLVLRAASENNPERAEEL